MSKSRTGSSKPKKASEPSSIELPVGAGADVETLRRYHAELGDLIERLDTDRSPFDRVSAHIRRHLPLYALVTIWGLMILLIPTVNDRGPAGTAGAITGAGGGEFFDDFEGADVDTPEGAEGTAALGETARRARATAARAGGATDVPTAEVEAGTGITRGGFECAPGVRQIPWSLYANECVAEFSGSNGGATYRGVDEKTIRIAIRHWAVDAGDVTDAQDQAAGRAGRAGAHALLRKYANWFGNNMELYGRKVEFVDFQSRVSNGVEEAQSRGKEGACADATDIAENLQAFGVLGYTTSFIETQPMADCAAERGLFVPFGASYFPQKWYDERWDPYVWHIYMECERIARDVAEYMGKRLHNRNAKWAKDPVYQQQKRVFGTYVPDNDGYQRCVDISENRFRDEYGGDIEHRFDYQLDVARFADQAEQAVVQFRAAGVTTLINACDTISTRFLTDAANRQGWGPEWFIIGVALQDTDGQARSFNQNVVDGHLFGLSQLGQVRLIEGQEGEAYETWKRAFPNEEPPPGFGDAYYRVLSMFMMLQAAGPVLTPENIARGLRAMPEGGGATGPFGTWSFKDDHTAIIDSREIYWVGSEQGFDGGNGAYVEANEGKRFRSGGWPREEPRIYPS